MFLFYWLVYGQISQFELVFAETGPLLSPYLYRPLRLGPSKIRSQDRLATVLYLELQNCENRVRGVLTD